jgi:hypothetical protein
MQQIIKVRMANKRAMDTMTITSLFFLKKEPVGVVGLELLVLSLVYDGVGTGAGFG